MTSLGWIRRWFGDRGERLAARHLQGKGYRILLRQVRNRFGEIDLVATDGATIVFVEVKSRARRKPGSPADAVNSGKQRRMTKTALAWLKRRGLLERRTRFDVVAIEWPDGEPPDIRHFPGAFDVPDFGQLY